MKTKSKSTVDLSKIIKQILLNSLESIDNNLKEATEVQKQLSNDLERIQADHQLLIIMIESGHKIIESGHKIIESAGHEADHKIHQLSDHHPLDINHELVKTDLLKKRLLNLQRKIVKLNSL